MHCLYVVVVTDMIDTEGSPIIATVMADGKGMYINKEKAITLSTGSSTQWLEQLEGYDFNTMRTEKKTLLMRLTSDTRRPERADTYLPRKAVLLGTVYAAKIKKSTPI